MRLLGGNLCPWVPRAHRNVPKPQAPQQFADASLVQVQRAGKQPMSSEEFLRGTAVKAGMAVS